MSLRLAIVGCGAIASAHALAAQNLGPERCEIVALCDPERAVEFRKKFAPNALIFSDVITLLEQTSLDAVLICTPPDTHVRLATECIMRDVPVLCEKPLAIDTQMATELIQLAIKREVILRTSAKYRFVDGIQLAKAYLSDGKIGEIQQVEIKFGVPVNMHNLWQTSPKKSGGGVLMDNGPHAIDLARYLLGEVHLRDVELRYGEYEVEDEAVLKLVDETGTSIFIELSWRRKLGPTFLKIGGSLGKFEVNWESIVWQPHEEPAQIVAGGYDKNQVFTRQLASFLNEISFQTDSKIEPLWNREDGLRVVQTIKEAYSQEKR